MRGEDASSPRFAVMAYYAAFLDRIPLARRDNSWESRRRDSNSFIQPGKFSAQDVLVTAFLFLQCLDLHDPPLHGGGTAAAGLDEVVRALLVLRDLLFDRQVELLGHLVALLGVVDEVEAVGKQWGIVAVSRLTSSMNVSNTTTCSMVCRGTK